MNIPFGRHRGGRRHPRRGPRAGRRGYAAYYGPIYEPYYEDELFCYHDEQGRLCCKPATMLADDAPVSSSAPRPWYKRPLVLGSLALAAWLLA